MSRLDARPRVPVAIGLGLLLTILGSAPALADTERGHTGTTGVHSLVDSASSPGVKCKYAYNALHEYYKLKRITVVPPRVRAISGSQVVGWRFTVQRRWAFEGLSSWFETYSSPIQTVTTDSAHDASFTQKTVSVVGSTEFIQFRVLIKMFWYRPSGSVQGTATHRADWYQPVDYAWPDPEHYYCNGLG